jgi:WD40 repeat protein
LNHGTKPVSALSIDHSGARLISGSVDYEVKLWDFAGMSSSLQSFRTIRPCERYISVKKLDNIFNCNLM